MVIPMSTITTTRIAIVTGSDPSSAGSMAISSARSTTPPRQTEPAMSISSAPAWCVVLPVAANREGDSAAPRRSQATRTSRMPGRMKAAVCSESRVPSTTA